MSYNIVLTTAEDIVETVDAVLAKPEGCNQEFICQFTDLSPERIENAITMAQQLGFIREDIHSNIYCCASFLARIMISATEPSHKAALFRLALEEYEPYRTFKARLIFVKYPDTVAKQIKSLYSLNASHKDIRSTIISIATYSRSMIDSGVNVYELNPQDTEYIQLIAEAHSNRVGYENYLVKQLGSEAYDYIDKESVFNPLVDVYSLVQSEHIDLEMVVVKASNAFETFLTCVAQKKSKSLTGKNGIIQKAEALDLSKKHKGMIQYIGQIRNAADHGADIDENNKVWEISTETARIFPVIIAGLIKNIIARENGKVIV